MHVGVGVGDASASPTNALLLSIMKESTGRVATIAFAHRFGKTFEPECKMYRLAADIFNDSAIVLDCLSPVFPKGVRIMILSSSSILRALCGVAAGSSKASLSAHFARRGNLGELNAKDGSQETVIALAGMLVSSFSPREENKVTLTLCTVRKPSSLPHQVAYSHVDHAIASALYPFVYELCSGTCSKDENIQSATREHCYLKFVGCERCLDAKRGRPTGAYL